MSSADECGWRKYPATGTIQCDTSDPRCYDHADVMERILNYRAEAQQFNHAINSLLVNGYGVLESRWWNGPNTKTS